VRKTAAQPRDCPTLDKLGDVPGLLSTRWIPGAPPFALFEGWAPHLTETRTPHVNEVAALACPSQTAVRTFPVVQWRSQPA
jgi:hypothetical protein